MSLQESVLALLGNGRRDPETVGEAFSRATWARGIDAMNEREMALSYWGLVYGLAHAVRSGDGGDPVEIAADVSQTAVAVMNQHWGAFGPVNLNLSAMRAVAEEYARLRATGWVAPWTIACCLEALVDAVDDFDAAIDEGGTSQ
jgi:hypothetical protein